VIDCTRNIITSQSLKTRYATRPIDPTIKQMNFTPVGISVRNTPIANRNELRPMAIFVVNMVVLSGKENPTWLPKTKWVRRITSTGKLFG